VHVKPASSFDNSTMLSNCALSTNKRVRPLRGRPLWGRPCSWVRAWHIINYHTILIT